MHGNAPPRRSYAGLHFVKIRKWGCPVHTYSDLVQRFGCVPGLTPPPIPLWSCGLHGHGASVAWRQPTMQRNTFLPVPKPPSMMCCYPSGRHPRARPGGLFQGSAHQLGPPLHSPLQSHPHLHINGRSGAKFRRRGEGFSMLRVETLSLQWRVGDRQRLIGSNRARGHQPKGRVQRNATERTQRLRPWL